MTKRTDMPPGLAKLEAMERQVKRDRPTQRITSIADIGRFVTEVREILHITQVELATRAKVGRHWLIELEQGKQTCEVEKVLRTLETLGFEMNLTPYIPTPPWIVLAQHKAKARRQEINVLRNQRRWGRRAMARLDRLGSNAPRVEVDLD